MSAFVGAPANAPARASAGAPASAAGRAVRAEYRAVERSCGTARGEVRYWATRPAGPAPAADRSAPGPALVFLHGMTASHAMFDGQVARFAGRFPTIAWDAPLHGASRPYRGFSYAAAADDLAAILEAEGVERAVLVGQSMGGFMAQELIARHPARMAGLVAIDSCPYHPRYYSPSDLWWLCQVGWMMRLYPARMLAGALARQTCETEGGRAAMRAMLAPYGKRELCDLMGTCYRAFVEEHRAVAYPCPVLLVAGERDRTGKVLAYNRAWHAGEGHPLFIVPGAGHGANMDDPDAVNDALERFLSSLRAPS